MPEAAEPFVDYFRSIAGEHPDWGEYKQAMADQGKSLIRITPTNCGPVATGGFPPDVARPHGLRTDVLTLAGSIDVSRAGLLVAAHHLS